MFLYLYSPLSYLKHVRHKHIIGFAIFRTLISLAPLTTLYSRDTDPTNSKKYSFFKCTVLALQFPKSGFYYEKCCLGFIPIDLSILSTFLSGSVPNSSDKIWRILIHGLLLLYRTNIKLTLDTSFESMFFICNLQ